MDIGCQRCGSMDIVSKDLWMVDLNSKPPSHYVVKSSTCRICGHMWSIDTPAKLASIDTPVYIDDSPEEE